MRIYCLDRRYGINEVGASAFMQRQGFSSEAIARFSIHIRERSISPKKQLLSGEFKLPSLVYLYTHGDPESEVQHTLFHEMRHYWQAEQHRQAYWRAVQEYEQIKSKRERQCFYNAHLLLGDRPPSEVHLTYRDRPSELDANAFADEHSPQHHFVLRQQVFHVTLPPTIVAQCEVPLRAWLKRLGSTLLFDGDRVLAKNLTREDAQHLLGFLQRQSGRKVALTD